MISPLVNIMARLRDPETGCSWDVAQNFSSIAPYTIEEAHEVADAIARDDMDDLKDELGDLLLQVVFHARIAEEAGHFSIADVIETICKKMIRRHPHIFNENVVKAEASDEARGRWEAIKAEERAAKPDKSALAGVALGLPALLRAEKLQKRASRVGFDWPDTQGPREKIAEEMVEVEQAGTAAERVDELGDLLFSCVNWARHLKVDPEAALRGANRKFERRFRAMEEMSDTDFTTLPLDEKEALWQQVKRKE